MTKKKKHTKLCCCENLLLLVANDICLCTIGFISLAGFDVNVYTQTSSFFERFELEKEKKGREVVCARPSLLRFVVKI